MHDLTATVAGNFARVRAEIAAAARAAGRKPEEIRLIAVSKTHPPEAIATAIAAGQMDFGENTVQEALTKIPLYASATWHMIGHLQSNKAKFVPGNFAWVHSVDSLRLAQRLSRLAQEKASSSIHCSRLTSPATRPSTACRRRSWLPCSIPY